MTVRRQRSVAGACGPWHVPPCAAMPSRDRHLLLALSAIVLGLLGATLLGAGDNVMLAAPVLVLVLPLLAGRYVGEEHLARLSAAFAPRPRRAVPTLTPSRLRAPRVLPRGGRLIAAALAVRPPPGA